MLVSDRLSCLKMASHFWCNIAECNKNLIDNDLVWITSCGHIFCDECGHVVLPYVSVNCPVCTQHLHSPFDIMKTELNPPSHFRKVNFYVKVNF